MANGQMEMIPETADTTVIPLAIDYLLSPWNLLMKFCWAFQRLLMWF